MADRTILLAEDDEQFRHSLGNFLRKHGFHVLLVEDGYQALECAINNTPDLMILDVHMPAGDGFSVHDRVRKHPEVALTPVIYMTHDPSSQVEEVAEDHGAWALMHKPFSLHEMLGNVQAALQQAA